MNLLGGGTAASALPAQALVMEAVHPGLRPPASRGGVRGVTDRRGAALEEPGGGRARLRRRPRFVAGREGAVDWSVRGGGGPAGGEGGGPSLSRVWRGGGVSLGAGRVVPVRGRPPLAGCGGGGGGLLRLPEAQLVLAGPAHGVTGAAGSRAFGRAAGRAGARGAVLRPRLLPGPVRGGSPEGGSAVIGRPSGSAGCGMLGVVVSGGSG